MELTTGNWITIVIYLVTFSGACGVFTQKIDHLEKKQDKHNNLIERMSTVEASAKSAHHRIDSLEDETSCLDCKNFENR